VVQCFSDKKKKQIDGSDGRKGMGKELPTKKRGRGGARKLNKNRKERRILLKKGRIPPPRNERNK